MAKFRLWRVLLIVAVFLAIVLSPIAWQKYREARRRQQVRDNLNNLSQAIGEFERKKAASERAATASEPPAN